MIIHFELFLRRLRRFLSRSRWVVKLLKLPWRATRPHEPGLVILQIDGLSRTQLESALKRGRMPFLRELLDREEYRLVSHYSGVPSTTPAVQGELFYGKTQAVPAFHFIDRSTGRERVMFDADSVNQVAESLSSTEQEPLLTNGSSYSNIYAGGAGEARFCAQTLSLESWLKRANPFSVFLTLALHTVAVFRILGLMGIEAGLAIYDCCNGILRRHKVLPEVKFAISRIGICIVLRELIRFMVKADIVRGLPIIHANFLGYDEQSHRRGPSSGFAHWSLKGIDGVVKDVFRTAMRAPSREYHVVILSDHGQEEATSYRHQHGLSVRKKIAVLCRDFGLTAEVKPQETPISEDRRHRARHHFRLARQLRRRFAAPGRDGSPVRVTAMGPLGHVYLQKPISGDDKTALARYLAVGGAIPWVFAAKDESTILAISEAHEVDFTKHPELVLGTDHPFLEEAAADMGELCRHANAGDLLIWGGGADEFITFAAAENGSHGGPGREETHGFFLHPPEIQPRLRNGHMRPRDIRETIQAWFSTAEKRNLAKYPPHGHAQRLRVVTYNIHSCIGMDGKVLPERIAAVLRRLRPDLVALQEVDSGRKRSFYHDQLARIAAEMHMKHLYLPLVREKGGEYGIAIMSRLPFETVRTEAYATPAGRQYFEQRGLIWVKAQVEGQTVHFMNTHFGLFGREQMEQATQLTGAGFLDAIPEGEKVVLCGDFNSLPGSKPYTLLTERLHDVQRLTRNHKPLPTFFGRRPMFRIDHIFVSEGVDVQHVDIPKSTMARIASDHLPLCADLEWEIEQGDRESHESRRE